jgi:hypothetical protein
MMGEGVLCLLGNERNISAGSRKKIEKAATKYGLIIWKQCWRWLNFDKQQRTVCKLHRQAFLGTCWRLLALYVIFLNIWRLQDTIKAGGRIFKASCDEVVTFSGNTWSQQQRQLRSIIAWTSLLRYNVLKLAPFLLTFERSRLLAEIFSSTWLSSVEVGAIPTAAERCDLTAGLRKA